jgi:hypothetical protein
MTAHFHLVELAVKEEFSVYGPLIIFSLTQVGYFGIALLLLVGALAYSIEPHLRRNPP